MSYYISLPPLRTGSSPVCKLPGICRVWRRNPLTGRLRLVGNFGTRTKRSRI